MQGSTQQEKQHPPASSGGQEVLQSCLIRLAARLLRLPARASIAALTYWRSYLASRDLMPAQERQPDHIVAAACIFLASKVEEAPVSNNHLLNLMTLLHQLASTHKLGVTHLLPPMPQQADPGSQQPGATGDQQQQSQGEQQHSAPAVAGGTGGQQQQGEQQLSPPTITNATASQRQHHPQGRQQHTAPTRADVSGDQLDSISGVAPARPTVTPWTVPSLLSSAAGHTSVLVGEAYQAAKGRMLTAEQHLLRLRRFQLGTCQPGAALFHVASLIRAPGAVLALALQLLHDAAAFSDVLLQTEVHGPYMPPNGSVNQHVQAGVAAAAPGGAPAGATAASTETPAGVGVQAEATSSANGVTTSPILLPPPPTTPHELLLADVERESASVRVAASCLLLAAELLGQRLPGPTAVQQEQQAIQGQDTAHRHLHSVPSQPGVELSSGTGGRARVITDRRYSYGREYDKDVKAEEWQHRRSKSLDGRSGGSRWERDWDQGKGQHSHKDSRDRSRSSSRGRWGEEDGRSRSRSRGRDRSRSREHHRSRGRSRSRSAGRWQRDRSRSRDDRRLGDNSLGRDRSRGVPYEGSSRHAGGTLGAGQPDWNSLLESHNTCSAAAAQNDLQGGAEQEQNSGDGCEWVRAVGVEPEHAAATAGMILEALMSARAVVEQLDKQGAAAALRIAEGQCDGSDTAALQH